MCAIYTTVLGNTFVSWVCEYRLSDICTHIDRVLIEMKSQCWFMRMTEIKGTFFFFFSRGKKLCNVNIKLVKRETTRIKLNMWQVKHWSIRLWFSFYFTGFDNEWAATCARAHIRIVTIVMPYDPCFIVFSSLSRALSPSLCVWRWWCFIGYLVVGINANVYNELITWFEPGINALTWDCCGILQQQKQQQQPTKFKVNDKSTWFKCCFNTNTWKLFRAIYLPKGDLKEKKWENYGCLATAIESEKARDCTPNFKTPHESKNSYLYTWHIQPNVFTDIN